MAKKTVGKVCAYNHEHRYTIAEHAALPRIREVPYCNKPFCGSIAFYDITEDVSEDAMEIERKSV